VPLRTDDHDQLRLCASRLKIIHEDISPGVIAQARSWLADCGASRVTLLACAACCNHFRRARGPRRYYSWSLHPVLTTRRGGLSRFSLPSEAAGATQPSAPRCEDDLRAMKRRRPCPQVGFRQQRQLWRSGLAQVW